MIDKIKTVWQGGIVMVLRVCMGSSCYIKGSNEIITIFRGLLKEHNIEDKVDFGGEFCLGNCVKGVSVKLDEEIHSVSKDNAKEFFLENILEMVR